MKKYKVIFFVVTICIFCLIKTSAVTRVAVGSGNWGNGATWLPTGIPACGDSVYIPATYTVDVTNQEDYTNCASPIEVVIQGTLWFHKGTKLRFSCGSYVIALLGGSINHDAGLSNSNFIEICGTVQWNSSSPTDGPQCLPPTLSFSICSKPLPVQLVNFKAEVCNEKNMCLSWQTISENNNAFFVVERSENAIDFKGILEIESKAIGGNSNSKIDYSGIDQNPVSGLNYYRLKQMNKDLVVAYSKLISVQIYPDHELQFFIYPNSNSGEFTLEIKGLKDLGSINLLLRDGSGSTVYRTMYEMYDPAGRLNVVPSPKLSKGIYFCSVEIGGTEHRAGVIVVNP